MEGNKFLIEVGVDTSPAEKDLAAFMNKLSSMRERAASEDSKSTSAQLPPQVAAAAFSDAPIDLSKQTSDLKEQAKIQRQIVQDRGKLIGLLQEEARIAGSIDSGELQNIRKGAEDALAAAFGGGKLSASLKGALTKAINETVTAIRVPEGNLSRSEYLTAKTTPAPRERFVTRSAPILKTVGINAPAAIRPNVDILKDFNKAVSSSQGDVLGILNSIGTSFGKVVEGVEAIAGNFASAAKDQGKALDDMTSSMTETAKTVGKINSDILKGLADKAKKAAVDSQKSYGARQKEVIKTVIDNPGISYEELKATGAPAQSIQSLTNRGLKRTGDNFDVDVSALTNFDAELTKVLSEFVGPVAGSLTQIQELQDSVKRLVSGIDTVAVEAENTAQAVAQDGLFGEKGKAEPVRKGTIPEDEPAPARKEKFAQTNFLAQEQTIEDALEAKGNGLAEEVRQLEILGKLSDDQIKSYVKFVQLLEARNALVEKSNILPLNTEEEKAAKRQANAQIAEYDKQLKPLRSPSYKIPGVKDFEVQEVLEDNKATLVSQFGEAVEDATASVETLAQKTAEASGEFGPGTTSRRAELPGGPTTEMVPVSILSKIQPGNELGKTDIKDLGAKMLADGGPTTEGLINYYVQSAKAVIAEGNHRIAAAIEAGITELPFRVNRLNMEAPEGVGTPVRGITEEMRHIPQELKPSQIMDIQEPVAEMIRAVENITEVIAQSSDKLKESYYNDYSSARVTDNGPGNDSLITNLATRDDKRGQGFASDVLNQITADADALGRDLVLSARDQLEDFYGQFGFQKTGDQLFGLPEYKRLAQSASDLADATEVAADEHIRLGEQAANLTKAQVAAIQKYSTDAGQATLNDKGSAGLFSYDMADTLKAKDFAQGIVDDPAASAVAKRAADSILKSTEFTMRALRMSAGNAEEVAKLGSDQAVVDAVILAEKEKTAQRAAAVNDAFGDPNEANRLAEATSAAADATESYEEAMKRKWAEADAAFGRGSRATVGSPGGQATGGNPDIGGPGFTLQNDLSKAIYQSPDEAWIEFNDKLAQLTLANLSDTEAELVKQLAAEQAITNSRLMEQGMAELAARLEAQRAESRQKIIDKEDAVQISNEQNAIGGQIISAMEDELKARREAADAAAKAPLSELDKQALANAQQTALIPEVEPKKAVKITGLTAEEAEKLYYDRSITNYGEVGTPERPRAKLSNFKSLDIGPEAVDEITKTISARLQRLTDDVFSTIEEEIRSNISTVKADIPETQEFEFGNQFSSLSRNVGRLGEANDSAELTIKLAKALGLQVDQAEANLARSKEVEAALFTEVNEGYNAAKAIQERAEIQENINDKLSKEVLVPDKVIPAPGSALVPTGEKVPGVQSGEPNGLVIDAASTVKESAERLSASMDESLTAVKGLSPAMLAVIDILESTQLSLGEFTKSFGSRGASLKALITRGAVTTNDQGKLTVAPREEIPGLFQASSDRKLDAKRGAKSEAIEQAKAEADAIVEQYGVEVVQAFSDNLEYFNQQYVDFLTTRIEALEINLGDSENGGALGSIEIPTPLINKDLYQRFGEVVGPEWDFYVEAFLKENAPGLISFQGTKFTKSDIDSLLFSESDPQLQASNAYDDIRQRVEAGQSRLPGESVATEFEDFLANTPGLREANLSIDEYVTQLLELVATSEEVRNVSAGLSGVDISTAMSLFTEDLEEMANVNDQIAAAIRSEREAKLEAIAENKAALQVYKEAFEFANGDDFSELSTALQEALQEDLRQAATEASAVLRANEPILGEASTARTINVDEGQAIDNLIGIQNSLENKIFDEAVANLAPLEDAQQLLINEVVDGAKIEAQTNEQRLSNLGKTKAAEPIDTAEVPVNGQFVDGESGLVSALARKIEALDKQSSVLENIYPSFEEAERELVYALNRKRQLLDQQSKSIEDAGVTLPSISEIDPFQSGGAGGGPKYGVNPYDTMNPGGSGGGSSKSGLVGEGDEEGFDPVEAALARIEAAEKNLLTNIALFSAVFEDSGQLFADKLAELQAGIQGFNAALEGKTLIELINQPDSFKNATQGGAEKLAGESVIEGQTAAELLAKGNEDLLYFFVEGQKLLAASMQEISKKIFDQNLEADKKINKAWENAETAFAILTETNIKSGEKLSDLFSDYTSKLAVFNQQLSTLTKEGITEDPKLLGQIGEAKGRSRIADTTIAGQTNQSILNTINNNPEEGEGRNLVQELLDAQIELIRTTSELAELRNDQILQTKDVLEQLADEDTSIQNLKNAREATAQSLANNLPAGAQKDFLALQRRVKQKELNVNNPAFIQLRQQEADLRQREARAISGEAQAPGITGRVTRYLGYQPERGGAGFKQFFGGGALAALRYGLPGQALRSGGTKLAETIKEAEELKFALARLEGQFKTAFPQGDFDAVRDNIKGVAKDTGLAADEIANFQIQITGAFADVEIGGLGGTDLVEKQVESAAKLAQTVGLPLAEITDGLTAASLAFGEDFERIGDVAVRLEERSGVLARETIAFIGDIAPVAEEAGYSLEEFAALAAVAQQRSGRSGAALAESFGRVIPALSEQKDKLMELAAITPSLQTPGFIDAIRQSDSKAILDEIGKAYQNMGVDAKQATVAILGGRREAQALIPALANSELVERLQKDAEGSVGSLDKRFEDVQKTLTNSLARLGESVRGFAVELLDSGITDTFELAISLAEKLLGVLTPIAGVFADINKTLGGVPALLTALGLAGATLNAFAFKDKIELITDPLTGVESESVTKQFVGTEFIQGLGESLRENFDAGFRDSLSKPAFETLSQRYGPNIPVADASALAASGISNKSLRDLTGPGQKIKAGATGLLSTIGGGSAALGAGVVGITALSTVYGFIQGQINEVQAALDDLIRETDNQIASTDLDVDGARQRLTENLRVQAEDAREGYDGLTEFFGEIGGKLNPGDYLDAQATFIGASDELRDALKIFDSSDSLRKDIFQEYKVTLGKNTGGLRDIASDYKTVIESTNGYIKEDVDGAFRLYGEGGDRFGNAAITGQDAEYLKNLSSALGIKPEDLDFGFVEATLQKDADVQLLKLAKGDTEALDAYGVDAQEQAIQYVELLSGLGRNDPKFAKEIDALLEEIGKLPPLESNQLKTEELRAAYDVGVISFEQYSSRLLANLEARRRLLETQDQTEASELELLQLKQQEQAAYREFAEIIIQRQEKALSFDTAIGGLGDNQTSIISRQNNIDNLSNPNFNDRDLREKAVLDIIEADKQIALNMALASGDINVINELFREGIDIAPQAQAIAAIDSIQGTEAWTKITEDMLNVFKRLFDIETTSEDIENWYEKILTDAYDDGQLNPSNRSNVKGRLDSVILGLNSATFDDLNAEDQQALETSFDELIGLLSIGGAKREELLAALADNDKYADLSPKDLGIALDKILEGNVFKPDPEKQAKINRADEVAANDSFYSIKAAEAGNNKILIAEAKKANADANLLIAVGGGDQKEINAAKAAQLAAEQELNQVYSDAQVAKLQYYSTMAKINGDLIGAINYNIQGLQRELQLAKANGADPSTILALEGQIATEFDNRRKQNVANANAFSQLYGGLATLRGDLVEAALFGLQEANNNVDAARTPEEKAAAALAKAQANSEVIKAQFAERARDFDLFAAFLSSNGDSFNAAKTLLIKAQENLKSAERGGNKDDINAARIELLNQEAAFRQATGARRDGEFELLSKILAGDDPVKQAILEQAAATEALARAIGPDEIRDATMRKIDADRALAASRNEVRIAMMGLRQAEAQAVEDEVAAAQIGVEIARQQLNDLIKAGAGDAAIANGRAALITADKAAKDAVFNERQDEYKWLLDMGRISKSQYINYLEGLKSTLIPGTKSFRDLELAIKQLKDDIGGDLQANLPTSLKLPTLYEVRRFDQTGASSGGATASGIGYQDNRQVSVNVNINGADPDVTGQVVAAMEDVLGVNRSGFGQRRF